MIDDLSVGRQTLSGDLIVLPAKKFKFEKYIIDILKGVCHEIFEQNTYFINRLNIYDFSSRY